MNRRPRSRPPRAPRRPGTAVPALRTLTALVVALLAVAGCSGTFRGGVDPTPPSAGTSAPASEDPARQQAFQRFYGQPVSWRGCGDGFECSTVTVPVDWDAPGGTTLDLAVIRRKATGSRIGSMLVNPGGPGVSGVDWLRQSSLAYGQSLRSAFDLVGWDPRGTGASAPIRCLSDVEMDQYLAVDPTPDNPAEQQALLDAIARFDAGCKQDTGPVLAHVDTLSTVKDMDVLRAVLGDQTLSYFGASYGTFLGAWYAQTFPWRVGRLVLDGAVDPSLDSEGYIDGQAGGFNLALTAYLQDCLKQQGCPLRGSVQDGTAQLQALLDGADAQPLSTGSGRPLTESLMSTGIVQGLYTPSLWKRLTKAMTQALQGDGTGLLALADEYDQRDANGHYATTLQATGPIFCLDHPETRTVDQIAADARQLGQRYPPLGDSMAWAAVSCVGYPIPAVLTPQRLTAPGAAPILVVGTTGDPATPYEWAKALASQLSSGRLLTREGTGHTAYFEGSTCIDTAVEKYLVAGILPDPGTTCH
jgi:pimeloyl-ACP methyl ester carboxylesterase